MKPRETGGNVPKAKARKVRRVTPPKPEVAVKAPKPRVVKVAPEATRPVTHTQRKAIEQNWRVENARHNAKIYKQAAQKDRPTILQASAMHIPAPVVKALTTSSGTAMKILEKTTVPLHAVAGAADNATGRGVKGLTPRQLVKGAETGLKNRTTYSDVLKSAGVKNRVVRAGVGLTGDVLLDPTTYLTFGAAVPAKAAATQAAKAVEKKALAKGLTETQAKRMGERKARTILKEHAAEGTDNKGLTVGVGKRRTSGKTTAKVFRATGTSTTVKRLREGRKVLTGEEKARPKGMGSLADDTIGSVAPGYRKTGIPEKAHQTVRHAEAEKRAAVSAHEQRLTRLAKAFEKDLSQEEYATIIDAVESGTVGALKKTSPKLHDAAVTLRSEFRHMDRLDRQAGIRAGSRKNYVYHLNEKKAATEAPRSARPARGGNSAKKRTIDGRIAELREAHPELFSEDVPKILAVRGPQTIRGVADVKLMRKLTGTGTRYTGADLAPGEAVYHVPAKSSVPKKLNASEKRTLDKGKRQNGQYVVLNEQLTENTLRNTKPAELSGLRLRYRRAHGKVKTVLTMPMPSYHLRNAQGDISNASYNLNVKELGSALNTSRKVLKVRRQVRKAEGSLTPGAAQKFESGKTVKIGNESVPVEKLLREAQEHGAVGQGFSRELRALAGEAEHGKESKLRDLGQGREDWVRMASYVGGRRQGLTATEAAERVRNSHFDYMDLTPTERGLRDLMPFYTFAARNTPFQAKTLLQRPGKLARYQKVVEEGSKAAGIPPEDLHNYLQEYERIGLGIPAFGLRVAGMPLQLLPGNPATDLNRLTLSPVEQAKQIASMVTIYKAVPEAIFNYSLFFRNQIDQGSKVAAPDWLNAVVKHLGPGAKKELGLEYIYDKRYKRKVWKYKAKWDYLLKQLPETSFGLGITTSAKNRRGQDKDLKLLSLSGVRPQPIDKVSVDLDKAYQRQTSIGNRIKQLNKAGVSMEAIKNGTVPRDSHELVREYKRLNEKRNKVGETIYNLTLLQFKRGDAVTLPKTGAPTKVRPTGNLINESSGPSVADILGHDAPTLNDILGP